MSTGGSDSATGISIDCSGNSYITGTFRGTITFGDLPSLSSIQTTIFVAKLSSVGVWEWSQQTTSTTGGTIINNGIGVDCEGNCHITGSFRNVISFGDLPHLFTVNSTTFVAKLDSNGEWVWAIGTTSGADGNFSNALSMDCNGNSYITGTFIDMMTLGDFTLVGVGFSNGFVAKVNTNGEWVWAEKVVGVVGNSFITSNGVSVDEYGDSYITGQFTSSATFNQITVTGLNDMFIAKISTNGQWLWAQKGGGEGSDVGRGVQVDCNGNVYTIGYFTSPAKFGSTTLTSTKDRPVFYGKLSPNGEWLWVLGADTDGISASTDISVDCNGNAYACGSFRGEATFGSITVTGNDKGDIYVTKINNNNVGTIGILAETANESEIVSVCFPDGVFIKEVYENLIPGSNYYINKNCELSTCSKCAVRYVGVAITTTKMMTGASTYCK